MIYKDMTFTPEHRRLDYSYSSTRDYPDDVSDFIDEIDDDGMKFVVAAGAAVALAFLVFIVVGVCCAVSDVSRKPCVQFVVM